MVSKIPQHDFHESETDHPQDIFDLDQTEFLYQSQ